MRTELYQIIKSKKEWQQFIRNEPIWYKKLSRNPNAIKEFEQTALKYYKKSLPDRMNKISNGVQFATMMLSMIQSMNQVD
ncbi:YlbE-like family protein [Caldifermentibacillus hisashii]|uniref:YlbE-like family protein n=1 Tax=Caldifermentibacillus hisashii TaxID=996558 RepID=UPI001C11FFAB|nr:YlbE-like family protein [Caldifermentibacillus hisashii]MBU5341909.1 YlbE-like family protein [Caldifermentibacillus hisashii]